ncbi:YfhO family protein [Candidatus Curtissbacteria bacterium]|nr:YfhO family protein [Candidatus Curtissbacteria bacterium]
MKPKTNYLAILIVLLVSSSIFFKIPLKNLYPVPSDMLVSFYFPWYSGQWDGYNSFTTRKELLSADAVRQIYIWKDFAASMFRAGKIPLWNPYTFSGQPLLANFQSSVFYPLNFFYLFFNARVAWIILIITQPLLAGLFTYLFLRSLKISYLGAIFGSTAFVYSSYFITWLENGNIAHSYLYLPLSLLAGQKYFENRKFRYVILSVVSLSLSILAGHPQTAMYIYATFSAFWIFKFIQNKKQYKEILVLSAIIIFSIGISAIQIIPTVAFYKQSPVSLTFSKEIFNQFILPYENLITFLAPDFFGHPASNNLWSKNYGDFTPYIGVLPFIFSIWGIIVARKESFYKFGILIGTVFLLASIASPVSYAVKILQIPILDSTSSARFISITLFMLVVFAAFGLDNFQKSVSNNKTNKNFLKLLAVFGTIYAVIWIIVSYLKSSPQVTGTTRANFAITQRNLIIPTLLFSCLPLALLVIQVFKTNKWVKDYKESIVIFAVFFSTILGGLYFTNKYLPTAPLNYIFPEHKLFTYLQNNAGINRFEGFGTAYVDRNFPTVYKLFGVGGYDTLRNKRYAELIASSQNGKVPEIYPRSDAILPNTENGYRSRLLNLLGVKYIVDKEDDPKTGHDWHYERYTPDKLKGIWQDGKFQVYERDNALPRFFATNKYIVETNDNKIIEKIYDSNFDLHTLILEEEPTLLIEKESTLDSTVSIVKYEPNQVVFESKSNMNALVFLSDNYDSDWQVYINSKREKLLRTDYTLRAVTVPAGESEIKFVYKPKSFTQGVSISMITTVALASISLFVAKRKKL